MSYGVGISETSFGSMQKQFSDTAVKALGSTKPGSKTVTKHEKSAGGALKSGLGLGQAGYKVGSMIGMAGAGAAATAAETAAAGAAGGVWGLGIGGLIGIAGYFFG